MVKITQEHIDRIVICPVCKQKRRGGKMMCGTNKPICSYCYKKQEGVSNA